MGKSTISCHLFFSLAKNDRRAVQFPAAARCALSNALWGDDVASMACPSLVLLCRGEQMPMMRSGVATAGFPIRNHNTVNPGLIN